MKRIAMRVIADSPLAIRADQSPNSAGRVRYIPGSTLLGGLTMFYRLHYERNQEKMAQFVPLFLNERVLYPNLYPASFVNIREAKQEEGLALQDNKLLPVVPIPQTAQSCKRHPGFRFPVTEKNDGHGLRDTLIDWGLFELSISDRSQALKIIQMGKDCRHILYGTTRCQQAMDHIDGYYRRSDIKPDERIGAKPDSYTRLQTRTGISRESGTVQDGILYNRQVFEEGMQFWGELLFPDDDNLFQTFDTFITEIQDMRVLHLGTGRSRGMGKISLSIEPLPDAQGCYADFSRRLDQFNSAFHERAKKFGVKLPDDAYFFAMTLHSPLIVCDDLLRYQGIIDTNMLIEALSPDCHLPGLKSVYHAASIRRIVGWQELWGTPRAAEYAIESGSTFLFSCSSSLDDTTRKALLALEEQGMGKRRAEGFGRVCVSDPFHQLVQQEGTQV